MSEQTWAEGPAGMVMSHGMTWKAAALAARLNAYEARIADLQRALDVAEESADERWTNALLAEGQVEKLQAALNAERGYKEFAQQKWNECSVALRTNMDTINRLMEELDAERETLRLEQAHLADALTTVAAEREARQQAEDFANQIQAELDEARQDRQDAEKRAQQAEGEAAQLRVVLLGADNGVRAAEARLADAVGLLRRMHDEMDDLNAMPEAGGPVCWFCNETGYDGNGLIHRDDCVLPTVRAFLARVDASAEEPAT